MKILIVSQYFWPENFRINEICLSLKDKGHQVEVLTGVPNYPTGEIYPLYKKNIENYQFYNGVKIYRMNIRTRKKGSKIDIFLNYLSFFTRSFFFSYFKLRKNNYDLIFSFGTSPVTNSIIPIFLSKFTKSKTALWVLDLWPEIIFELKIIKNFFIKFLFIKLMKFIYSKHDIIFGQSESFVKKLKSKIPDDQKHKVKELNAWPEELDELKHPNQDIYFKKDYLNIVFTGNVGEAQNFEYILSVANKLKNLKIKWHIIGGGRYLSALEEENINNKSIIFYGLKDKKEIFNYLISADVLLITLKGGESINSTIPGKFQTYLLANKMILGSIAGEVDDLIKKYKIGLSSHPNDEENFIKNIKYFLKMKEEKKSFTINTIELKDKFNKEKIINFLNTEILDLSNEFNYLNLIYKTLDIPFDRNFILSAINLAWLGYYSKGEIKPEINYIFWPDGLFYKNIYRNKEVRKIPGRELVQDLKLPPEIKKIHVIGNASKNALNYLNNNHENIELKHTSLPYADVETLSSLVPKLEDDEVTLLTIPTPKQEQLATLLSKKNSNYKILCIGGAIRMLCGDEPPAPKLFYILNLEFLWRLRFETRRRVHRLFESFYYYIIAKFRGKFNNLKEKN